MDPFIDPVVFECRQLASSNKRETHEVQDGIDTYLGWESCSHVTH